jgi:hypothetical protein
LFNVTLSFSGESASSLYRQFGSDEVAQNVLAHPRRQTGTLESSIRTGETDKCVVMRQQKRRPFARAYEVQFVNEHVGRDG